jgi:predicted ArsR family transcriptional regulator
MARRCVARRTNPEEAAVAPSSDTPQIADAIVHRALASPTREHLLELLRSTAEQLDVQELALEVGLHPNTVRSHLAILENAGLIVSSRVPSSGPGRPRHVYRATGHREARRDGSEGYRLLATVLADRLRSAGPSASDAVEDAATDWGTQMVDAADGELTADEAAARLVQLLARLGFGSHLDGKLADGAVLHVIDCPFSEVARTHPEVACAVHRGLTRGLLRALGDSVELLHMVADPDTRRCRATLRSSS